MTYYCSVGGAYKDLKSRSTYLSVLDRVNKLALGHSVLDVHLGDDVVDAALNLDREHGRGQARSVREHNQAFALLLAKKC